LGGPARPPPSSSLKEEVMKKIIIVLLASLLAVACSHGAGIRDPIIESKGISYDQYAIDLAE
jgi:hypothetical protein